MTVQSHTRECPQCGSDRVRRRKKHRHHKLSENAARNVRTALAGLCVAGVTLLGAGFLVGNEGGTGSVFTGIGALAFIGAILLGGGTLVWLWLPTMPSRHRQYSCSQCGHHWKDG